MSAGGAFFLRAIFGYALACLATALTGRLLVVPLVPGAYRAWSLLFDGLDALSVVWAASTLFLLGLMPGILIFVTLTRFRIRSCLSYQAIAVAISIIVVQQFTGLQDIGSADFYAKAVGTMALSFGVGAQVYWLVAGRLSGRLLSRAKAGEA